jgi:uncharacterized protein (DUF1015 family)
LVLSRYENVSTKSSLGTPPTRRRLISSPSDGVRHSAWVLGDAAEVGEIERALAELGSLYIADGHHRCAAAARVFLKLARGAETAPLFWSVIFPHNQVQILPYNRVLKDLNNLSPAQLLEKLDGVIHYPTRRACRAAPET